MDHDQRTKVLVKVFFQELLRLFFIEWAERLDFSEVEWLEKELFSNPPEGPKHYVDLIAKIKCKRKIDPSPCEQWDSLLCVIWMEVESRDSTTRLRPRMPGYYLSLRDSYGIPVLPIAIYLSVGLDGLGVDVVEESFGELDVLKFQYLYVGLPALDGVEYLEKDNDLAPALVSLMKLPEDRIAQIAADVMRKIAGNNRSEYEKFLLAEFFQTYCSMSQQAQVEYERILHTTTYEGARTMNKTTYEKGIEKGIETGIEKGIVRTVRRQLEKKFGNLSPTVIERIESRSLTELDDLALQIGTAVSLVELGLE